MIAPAEADYRDIVSGYATAPCARSRAILTPALAEQVVKALQSEAEVGGISPLYAATDHAAGHSLCRRLTGHRAARVHEASEKTPTHAACRID